MKKRAAGGTSIVARLLAASAALSFLLPATASAALDAPVTNLIVERPETDVLLLAVRIDQKTLAEALPIYTKVGGSGVLVPLGELCRLLDLGITVDVPHGLASGFFIDERRLFSLDVLSQRVIVEGEPKRFDVASIEVHRDDIYVDAALLSEWLPLHLNVDLYGSMITVQPRERLPLQLRLDREKKSELLGAGQRPPGSSYPQLELPYRLIDGPFIDQTLSLSSQPQPEGRRQNDAGHSTYATGDLLFMEASAFLAGTDHGLSEARFSLSRKDEEGRLLGSLGAREVTIGDLLGPGLDLIALPRSGPGLVVSSFPLHLPAQFDRQSFRGDLPPGWEVELYRADELLAYARSRPDGLYEFLDVPLLFGMNLFRLELYGPQGQHRSESRRFNVGETLTPKGQVYYRLVGNDPGLRLAGSSPMDARARASFEVSAGLTKYLSASGSVATVDLADHRHVYGKAGLRAFWRFLFANVDVAADRGGGSAWQATLQSRLGAFGFYFQHAALDAFVSEAFVSSAGPLRSRTTLRLNTAIPETFLPRIPVIVELREDRLESGGRIGELSGRVSAFRRGVSVANQVRWTFSSGDGPETPSTASGQLLVSKYLRAFAFRGEANYDLQPTRELSSVALIGETRLVKDLLLSAGISRLVRADHPRYYAGASKLEGAFGFGVTVDYTNSGGLGASVLLSMSLGRNPRNGRWHTQARALAGSGGVAGRVFLDANGNGRMDAQEKPIAGAGFLFNGAGSLVRTDDAGEAFIPNLTPHRPLEIGLVASTLEDPFWRPASEGVRLVPRPGKAAVVDFPVVISGEITGTVYLKRDGRSDAARGVELELIDPTGAVVQKVRTAYDGFYDLTEIRPGRYTLRVAGPPNGPERFVAAGPSRQLEMAPSGTVLEDVDFVLDVAPVPERQAPRSR